MNSPTRKWDPIGVDPRQRTRNRLRVAFERGLFPEPLRLLDGQDWILVALLQACGLPTIHKLPFASEYFFIFSGWCEKECITAGNMFILSRRFKLMEANALLRTPLGNHVGIRQETHTTRCGIDTNRPDLDSSTGRSKVIRWLGICRAIIPGKCFRTCRPNLRNSSRFFLYLGGSKQFPQVLG